ncbi:MAG: S1C family serine protease [Puniceicoccales bacterium]|nr:S1C family serine protease [Puniceicoccales bacterium]
MNALNVPFKEKEVDASRQSAVISGSEIGQPMLCALSSDIQNLFNRYKDAVVKVIGIQKGSGDREKLLFGTGFFCSQDGYILTAAMITTEAEDLWVEFHGLSYAATVIGKDPVTSIAVIKLLENPVQFTPILLPEKSHLRQNSEGSIVISLGCAFAMEPSPTLGLITGKNIVFGDRVFAITYLRSSIGIYGGESGAPVFGDNGDLCGILVASIPELRSSFILPGNALARIFRDIVDQKNVKYCTAGFSVRGKMSESGRKEVVISEIDTKKIRYQGSEILQIGDVVAVLDAQKIVNESDIADILFFKKPNDTLNLQVIRDKKTVTITIILDEKIYCGN